MILADLDDTICYLRSVRPFCVTHYAIARHQSCKGPLADEDYAVATAHHRVSLPRAAVCTVPYKYAMK